MSSNSKNHRAIILFFLFLLPFTKSITQGLEPGIKINLSSSSLKLDVLIHEIEKQTGIEIAYSDDIINKSITIHLKNDKNMKIDEIFTDLKNNFGIDCKVIGNNICLKKINKKNNPSTRPIKKNPKLNNMNTRKLNTDQKYINYPSSKIKCSRDKIALSPTPILLPHSATNSSDTLSNKDHPSPSKNKKKLMLWFNTGSQYFMVRHKFKHFPKNFPTLSIHAGLRADYTINSKVSLSSLFTYSYRFSRKNYSLSLPERFPMEYKNWEKLGFIIDMNNIYSMPHHYANFSITLNYRVFEKHFLCLGGTYSHGIPLNKDIEILGINYLEGLYGHHYFINTGISNYISNKIKIHLDYHHGLDRLFKMPYQNITWNIKESYLGISVDYSLSKK